MKTNDYGRSMIEMLGVLAIVGILSVGSLSGYSNAMLKYKTNRLSSETLEIIVNTRNTYLKQKNYKDISLDILSKVGAVPDNMYNRPGFVSEIYNAFNGRVKVFESFNGGTVPLAFEIYNTGISTKGCIALATFDWGNDPTSGFTALYIGEGNIDSAQMENIQLGTPSDETAGIYTIGTDVNSIPLDVIRATMACKCRDNECTVGLKYR